MDRLAKFAEEAGFTVNDEDGSVIADGVPSLLLDGEHGLRIGRCRIEKSYDSASGLPDQRIGGDTHAVRITTHEQNDGRVYHADGEPVGAYIGGDGQSWSNISIKKSSGSDATAGDVVFRYAKHIVGAAHAYANHSETVLASAADQAPFKIPNTFEGRSQIGPVQARVREDRVAIIGLGGTGSYVLDLVAKTPVAEIHLLDDDELNWHNLMRAPGAPTSDEIGELEGIQSQSSGEAKRKADYYHAKYAPFRVGVHVHLLRAGDQAEFAGFLSEHPIDFAFVCIDQAPDSDAPRQDAVYNALTEAGIPFVDSGVSITLEDNVISGAVTTSIHADGSQRWERAIPNAAVKGGLPGYRNVQLPEVNAAAAALAVMEWRRHTKQYAADPSSPFLHKLRLETPKIITAT